MWSTVWNPGRSNWPGRRLVSRCGSTCCPPASSMTGAYDTVADAAKAFGEIILAKTDDDIRSTFIEAYENLREAQDAADDAI